jgi:hypothetical protein
MDKWIRVLDRLEQADCQKKRQLRVSSTEHTVVGSGMTGSIGGGCGRLGLESKARGRDWLGRMSVRLSRRELEDIVYRADLDRVSMRRGVPLRVKEAARVACSSDESDSRNGVG